MKGQRNVISRRSTLEGIRAVGAMGLLVIRSCGGRRTYADGQRKVPASEVRRVIAEKVNATR